MPGFGRKNISLHVSIATVVLLAGHAAAVLEPQQFHASFSPGGASEMLVTWVTVGNHAAGVPTTNPMCLYDDRPAIPPAAMRWRVDANTRTYQDGKCDRAQCTPWDGYVHTATLTQLPPLTTVFYRCGDDQSGLSAERNFTSRPAASDNGASFSFVATADLGSSENALSVRDGMLHSLQDGSFGEAPLFFLQSGDVAYGDGNQTMWDVYGRVWEPVMQRIPTLLTVGNHDGQFRYGNPALGPGAKKTGGGDTGLSYVARYPGPGPVVYFNSNLTGLMNSTSFYWSIDVGPVHLVALSTVLDFKQGSEQYTWFERDLAKARAAKRPWIIATSHYPAYVSQSDCFSVYHTNATCEPNGTFYPGVLEITGRVIKDALEPLLLKYSVDVFLTGHEHAYERTYPVRDFVPSDTGSLNTYKNPGAPIHVMAGTGGGGPDEGWLHPKPSWSAVRSDGSFTDIHPFGWMRFDVSPSSLRVRYINSETTSANPVLDDFTIFKST